jgi:hypothetical protein
MRPQIEHSCRKSQCLLLTEAGFSYEASCGRASRPKAICILETSDLDLLRDLKSVVYFNAEVADG